MELTAGSEIPGVTVRFTRAAAEVGPDDEDDEEEGGLGNGGGYDSEGEVDSEAVELVLEVPALVSRDDSNDGIQCLTPMFHHPCEVTVEVVVDGVDLVPGSRSFRFYGESYRSCGAVWGVNAHSRRHECAPPQLHRRAFLWSATQCP